MINPFPDTVPDPKYLEERWFPICDFHINGIRPGYMISTWGRVYSEITGKFTPNENSESESYVNVYFRLKDGSIREITMHRLMMIVFNYIPGCEELTVNHKDGIKYHNWIWNLEWTDHAGNMYHAFETGLTPVGEQCSYATITNHQANMIAELLSKGLTPMEIEKQLCSIFPIGIRIHQITGDIARGQAWRRIRENYDMSNIYCKNTLERKYPFTDNETHKICQVFQKYGTDIPYRQVLNLIDFYYADLSQKAMGNLCVNISFLRRKEIKKEICNLYNYDYCPTTIES